jgi:hypothetical protein
MAVISDYVDEVLSVRWTYDEMCREKDRRLIEDLQTLGPRPAWWRRRARRLHDRSVRRLKKAHYKHLCEMLAIQDPTYRAIMGHLIGWKPPSRLVKRPEAR